MSAAKTRTRKVSPERIADVLVALEKRTGRRWTPRLLPGGMAELLTDDGRRVPVSAGESATDWPEPRTPDAP